MADGVTQLLSARNLKEIVGKDKLVRNKLLEELNSLFLFSGSLSASTAHNQNSFLPRIIRSIDPFSIANRVIYRGFMGERVPKKCSIMGVNSLITWAVIDPVMRAVITETQGSSVVETRALDLAFSH